MRNIPGNIVTAKRNAHTLSMVCASVRRDNPRALARGLSTVQAHKPCSILHVRVKSSLEVKSSQP